MSASLARRYVKPLFEAARDKGQLDRVAADLQLLAAALRSSSDLRKLIESPTIERASKRRTLEMLLKEATELTRAFVRVVVDKKRAEIFLLADRIFEELVTQHGGEERGTIQSAQALDDSTFAGIERAVARRFGGRVALERAVDPGLIGGVKVRVGNRVIDASVKGRLEKLKGILAGE